MDAARLRLFNSQLLQLADALLVGVAFHAASALLAPWSLGREVQDAWLLYLVVPFTPLLLEAFGFYRQSAGSSHSSVCLGAGLALMALGTSGFASATGDLVRLGAVMAIGFGFTFVLLFVRDGFVAFFRKPLP